MNNTHEEKDDKVTSSEKKSYKGFGNSKPSAPRKQSNDFQNQELKQDMIDTTSLLSVLQEKIKNSSMMMQSLAENTGIAFQAHDLKDLPDDIKIVWTPANPEDRKKIIDTKEIIVPKLNQLKYNNEGTVRPIKLLNEEITINYPLPEDKDCSHLKKVRYGIRQGGTFIISFCPQNSNHFSIVLSKSTYFKILSDLLKMKRNNSPSAHQINFDNRTENPNIESRLFVRYFLKQKTIVLCQIAIFINPETNNISKKYTAIGCDFDTFCEIEDSLDISDNSINTTVFDSFDNEISMGFFEKN